MNKGKLALRSIYACGLASYWVADWIGDNQAAPRWFASGVSEAVLLVAITTALLWVGLEILLHFVRHRGVWAPAFATSVASVAVPAFYLICAAQYGAEQANFSTWHLLALFAPMYQLFAIIITTLIAAGLALMVWLVRTVTSAVRRTADAR